MLNLKIRSLLIALATATALSAAPAHAGGFVKYDGMDGEAADANHDKWIDVLSVDHGATGGARQRGSVTMGDMSSEETSNTADDIQSKPNDARIGLLLPAIQKVRE